MREFTGYLDKNNQKIYEGDIIQFMSLEALKKDNPEDEWTYQDTLGVVGKVGEEWLILDLEDPAVGYDSLENVAHDSPIVDASFRGI